MINEKKETPNLYTYISQTQACWSLTTKKANQRHHDGEENPRIQLVISS